MTQLPRLTNYIAVGVLLTSLCGVAFSSPPPGKVSTPILGGQKLQQEDLDPETTSSSNIRDDSIIIDEDVWVRLVGEPGRHMNDAYDAFESGDIPAASESVDKAASFVYIAMHNADKRDGRRNALGAAGRALDQLSEELTAGKVTSARPMKVAFVKTHMALARHHARKSQDSLEQQQWSVSGSYMLSSASHLNRASHWAGRELSDETTRALEAAKREASRLLETKSNESRAASKRLLTALGKRIEVFGARLIDDAKKEGTDK